MTELNHIIEANLIPPQNLTLMITNGCNLRCLHCWPDSIPYHRAQPVPLEILSKVIFDFIQLGVKKICLSGGEPLTHPAWLEILSFACRQPEIDEVCLQTNATLLTETHVKKILSLHREELFFQVSLEGATAQTHDHVRGKGSFAGALKGLRLLVAGGLANQIRISLTETQQNFKEIPDLLKLLESLGIHNFNSGTLVWGGRAKTSKLISPPLPSQYRDLLAQYHSDPEFKHLYSKSKSINIAALEWYLGKSHTSQLGCRLMEKPLLTADGTLFPCVMLQDDKYAVKGVHDRSLKEILTAVLPQWSKLQKISQLRTTRLKACKVCPGKLHCGGGCMGRANTVQAKLMAVEDRCLLRQSVYKGHER